MALKNLAGMHVAILVTHDFEQVELTGPGEALQAAGATTAIISPEPGEVQGFNHDERADRFKVDLPLDKAAPQDFDAVLLPGGVINADSLRMERQAQEFVQEMDRAGRPIAVLCHAPWLLVSAGLVRGRKMTSYYTLQDDLRNAGAQWQDSEAVRDRNWVSCRQPDDIPTFNREMIALFIEYGRRGTKAA